jgi:hypothetical protein
MTEEKEAAKKAESDGSSDESESDATPPKRKKAKASDIELPQHKRRSTPYSFIFGRNK